MSARPAQSKAGVTFFTLATVDETVRMCLIVLNRLELVKGGPIGERGMGVWWAIGIQYPTH